MAAAEPALRGRTAAVVGAGPNGLAAAIVLARAGLEVTVYEAAPSPGGALRSAPVFGLGTIVDLGAAVHPLGIASPFFASLQLERHGLRWLQPDIPLAHPLDGRPAALLHRSLAETAAGLGVDAAAWRRLHEPLQRRWPAVLDLVLGPLLRVPADLGTAVRFGVRAAPPAQAIASTLFRSDATRALFAGNAAHALLPLDRITTGAFGVLFGVAAHTSGWPVAAGGSQAIADALVAELRSLGGRVITETPIDDRRALGPVDVVMLDTGPHAAARIAGDRIPLSVRRALQRWRYGTALHKVDYLLNGPVPWSDPRVAAAGTVHLGGTLAEVAAAEAAVAAGRQPERPFVLVAQQSAIDPSRAPGHNQVLYAYAHTPNGSISRTGSRIDAQIERFAPGFRDRILARVETTPAALAAWNANLVGGDVVGGAATLRQLLRPRLTTHPYRLGPGLYLCSASTPPGGGVHGMSGFHAANAALTDLRRRVDAPRRR